MKLDVWLEKDPPTAVRLKVIGSVCGALADSHKRGAVLGGVAPSQIDVANDAVARLEAGGLGSSSPYAAPELAQGGAPTPKSDIYSAAAVFYEILTGKPPFRSDPPRPLQEARPDLSRDLTDAVSACMEQDPEWRPADLSYLQAVVQKLQNDVAAPGRAGRARSAPAVRASGPPSTLLDAAPPRRRHDGRSPLTRALPVILVVVAIAGTAAAWFWYGVLQPGGAPASAPAAARTAPSPPHAPPIADAAAGDPAPVPSEPANLPLPAPSAALPGPAATPLATKGSPAATSPAPTPVPSAQRPTPVTLPAPLPTAAAAAPENSEPSGAASLPGSEPEPAPAATPAPATADQVAGPAAIRAVAPFKIRAGSLQVLDVHGSGLRADHRAKIVPLRKREAAAGFTVTRYQLRGDGLLLVFVQVDGAVRPGKYSLSLVDSAGAETNAFTIEVVNK